MSITPYTLLELGTPVRVNQLFGVIVEAKMVSAVPCGTICLHTIKFDKKRVKIRKSSGAIGYKFESIKEKTQTCNYAFIEIVN